MLFAGVVGAPLVLVGIIRVGIALARPPHRHPAAWLAVALVGVCVAFALSGGRSYYTLAILPALVALGAVELTAWAHGRARRTRGTLAALGFTVGAAAVLLSVPVLPAAWLAQIPGAPAAAVEAGERVMEPGAMAATAAYQALPDGTRRQTALFAQIYPLAAAVDVLGERAGGPPAYSPHRGYGYFAPPPESQTNALWVGFETVPDTFRAVLRGLRATTRRRPGGVALHGPDDAVGGDVALDPQPLTHARQHAELVQKCDLVAAIV